MGLILKTADRAIRRLLRDWERRQECLKKDGCAVQEDVHLYSSCRIVNLQTRRGAIQIGGHSHIRGELLVFAHGGDLRIGESCYIGEHSRIWSANSVGIGDRVFISHGVNIHDNNSHSVSAALRFRHFQQIVSTGHPSTFEDVASAPIVIEDDVWIGFNSTILKGITIGQGAIVGAASLVANDVPAYTIVAGSPARVIGNSRP